LNYFISKKINDLTTIFFFDLNQTISKVDFILALSGLILEQKKLGNKVVIKPDKRKRAIGLYVLFSNSHDHNKTQQNNIKENRKKLFLDWKIDEN
jgi:hypothetical protein